MAKHSQEPWHVGGVGGCRPKLVYDASGRTILRSWGSGSDEENEANVELAAQAPTLKKRVEALRKALNDANVQLAAQAPMLKKRMEELRRALQEISDYPANSNSDPDVMGGALDNSQEIAANALRDDDAAGGGGAA